LLTQVKEDMTEARYKTINSTMFKTKRTTT